MVDFTPIDVPTFERACFVLADLPVPEYACVRREAMLPILGRFADDYEIIAGCVHGQRQVDLALITDAYLSDLPSSMPESRLFVAYNMLMGVAPEKAYERPLCDLAGETYCRTLTLAAMLGRAVPSDVEHFYRLSFDSGFGVRRQEASARHVDQYYALLREIGPAKRRKL